MLRVSHSFDKEFVELYNFFNTNPKLLKMLELEGLGRDNLDIVEMSKRYFTNGHISDVSIDANANANDASNRSPNSYYAEVTKSIMKLDGYFLLWKYLKEQHSVEYANHLLGRLLKGDYYFHDASGFGVQSPYTYSPFEVVHVSPDLNVQHGEDISLQMLYNKLERIYKKHIPENGVEYIIPKELYIYDSGKMSKIHQVTKKTRNDKKMIEIYTSDGNHQIVTCDHPIITKTRGEIEAQRIEPGDIVTTFYSQQLDEERINYLDLIYEFSSRFLYDFFVDGTPLSEAYEKIISGNYTLDDFSMISGMHSKIGIPTKFVLNRDWGYFIGFYIAEGFMRYDSSLGYTVTICQNPSKEQDKILHILDKYHIQYKLKRDNTRIVIFNKALATLIRNVFQINNGAVNKNLPVKWKSYNKEFLTGIVEGLIDGDGTVFENKVSIRMAARTLIIQLKDLLNLLQLKTRIVNLKLKDREGSFSRKYPIYSIILAEYENELSLKEMFVGSCKIDDKLKTNKKRRQINIDGHGDVRIVEVKEMIIKDIDKSMDYIYDITTDTGTFSCNNIHSHNCFAYSTSILMHEGRQYGQLKSKAPKRARSFIGQVIETTMDFSQQVMGAVAIGDIFVNYAYYAKKEKLNIKEIENDFQNFVHIWNNPYRNSNQSAFTNVSIFDRNNLKLLFENYYYPDGSQIDIEYVMEIQMIFAKWFAEGDPSTGLPYRFPIATAAFLIDEKNGVSLDEEFLDTISKINLKTGLFNIYISNSVGKIASCCRLSNSFSELAGCDSFGNGGLSIGSARVVTLNLPRIAYKNVGNKDAFYEALNVKLEEVKDILNVHRVILHKRAAKGFLKFIQPLGWMNIDKMLFSTIGIIGIYECLQILGIDIREKEGVEEAQKILSIIRDKAREYTKKYNVGFNVEQIPGESVAIKFADKDKIMFGEDVAKYVMYSNQFIPLWEDFDLYDRIKLDGHFSKILTGGGITHLNISERLKHPAQMKKLIRFAIESGCEHFAVNYGFGECENGHVNVVGNAEICPQCQKRIINYYTRVIGYFVPVSSWHKTRREYEFPRRKFGKLV